MHSNCIRKLLRAAAAVFLPLLLAGCGGAAAALDVPAEGGGEFEVLWRANTAAVPPFGRIAVLDDGELCTVAANGGVFFTSPDFSAGGGAAGENESADGENAGAAFSLPADEYTAAACGGGIVAAVSRAGVLRVFSRAGESLWEAPLHTRVLGAPSIAGGRLFVLGGGGKVFAFTTITGELVWEYESPLQNILNTPAESAPAVAGERVFIGANSAGISALDFADGAPLWEEVIGGAGGANPIDNIANVTSPALRGKTACAAAYQAGVSCFAAESGKAIWNAPLSATRAVFLSAGRLFVADEKPALRAYNAANGLLLWETETAAAAASAPLLAGDAVFVGGGDGNLRVFSADSGELLWVENLGGEAVINLVAADGGDADGDFSEGVLSLTAGGGLALVRFSGE